MRSTGTQAVNEVADQIRKLREDLGLSQTALADRLGVTPMSISRWERGQQEPSARYLILLGNLAHDDRRNLFWKTAGLPLTNLLGSEPSTVAVRFANAAGKQPADINLVAVPLLQVAAGASENPKADIGPETPISAAFAVPQNWNANPAKTISLTVVGDSMSPLLASGFVIAVDLSISSENELMNQIVLARHPQHGLRVCWLRAGQSGAVFHSENPEYPDVRLAPDWTLLGKIVWWLGRPENIAAPS